MKVKDHLREMTSKKTYKNGEYKSFERLLFLSVTDMTRIATAGNDARACRSRGRRLTKGH